LISLLRRKWIESRPFPENWLRIVEQDVPVYRRLPQRYKDVIQQRIQVLMREKYFEGCGGMEMNERIKIVISAYASVLILEEKSDYYGDLQSILVYPDDYVAPVFHEDEGGIISEGYESRKGEYWQGGVIVLSWADIDNQLYGSEKDSGQNLIYHEFSHFLDDRYGLTAGIDSEGKTLREDEWTRSLAKAYSDLRFNRSMGGKSVFDEYGAVNPAEFFSVATELFFEKPQRFLEENRDLYLLYKEFYRLDPIRWK
jgi:MtfA peptidase